MESLDTEPCFVDDLLNFSSDIDEEEDDKPKRALASSLKPNGPAGPAGDSVRPFHVSSCVVFCSGCLSFLSFSPSLFPERKRERETEFLVGGDSAESSLCSTRVDSVGFREYSARVDSGEFSEVGHTIFIEDWWVVY
ncbi:hypothetical protein TIFTF001_032869 [Ficus carica]|uniref:Uncharacterized protein n=1 Tax=Ficus carica TaxID=3494 RepID=A0AA88E487_FICCA|nr:hypothetical protein TIFTF001_032869 [Ficus carica]